MTLALRDYQLEAGRAVVDAVDRGIRRQLVALPTGLGKTVILTRLPHLLDIQHPDVTLIIAPRDEIILQTAAKLRAWDPGLWIEIEKGERRAGPMAQIVVASVASLHKGRLNDFLSRFPKRVRLLIIDECHHAVAPLYRDIAERILADRDDATLVGFTATPSHRGDGASLGAIFQEVVFHRNIRWAIDEGYLVDALCWQVRTKTSLDSVRTRAGDYALNELAVKVNTHDRNDAIVSAYLEHVPGRKAIAFTVDVEHARCLSERFLAAGVPAGFAHGQTPKGERAEIIARFRSGDIRVLTNCALWTEGFDEPSVEVVIGARPTQSSLLYTQMTGRGLRPLDEVARTLGPGTSGAERCARIEGSAKPHCTILDFADQAHQHTLMSFPTLWGLPASIDPHGDRITKIAADYDARETLVKEQTFTPIATSTTPVNLFADGHIEAAIAKYARLSWFATTNDIYQLKLPEGEGRSAMEIQVDHLAQCTVTYRVGNTVSVLGRTPSLKEAFRRAEGWIANNRPNVARLLRLDARWRREPPSQKQIRLLTDTLKLPREQLPKTKGEAHNLINQMLARQTG